MLREEWTGPQHSYIPRRRFATAEKEGTSTDTISIGTAEWYSWLEQHHAFTYETPRMTFTARKEQRRWRLGTGMHTVQASKRHSADLGK